MSLIFGIVDFKKGNDIDQSFEQMHEGLSRFPTKRFQSQQGENYHFGVMIRENRLSSKYDQAPLEYEHLIVSNFSRIDNREELFKIFELDIQQLNEIPDSVLIAKAYLKWGPTWAKYVLGEFVVAIWDKKKQKQYLVKDFLGQTALYYTLHEGVLYYASSMVGLNEVEALPKAINEPYLAGIFHRNYKEYDETIFQNRWTVLSNHYVEVDSQGRSKVEYYKVQKKTIRYKTKEQYYEEFRRLYYQAVKRRLSETGNTASCLSGGLDSGSVTAIASRILDQQGKGLHAFTMSSKYVKDEEMDDRHFVDEMRLAKMTAAHNPGITHHLVQEESNDILKEIDLTIYFSGQEFFNSNIYWLNKIFERTRGKGCDTLLNGKSGNFTVSWTGIGGENWLKRLLKLDKTFVKALLIKFFPKIIIKRSSAFLQYDNPGLSSCFLEKYDIEKRRKKYAIRWRNLQYNSAYKIKKEFLAIGKHGTTGWEDHTNYTGVFSWDPTSDQDLVEFCINVPNEVCCSDKQTRELIRSGLVEELPDEVRLNPIVGKQGMDNFYFLKDNMNALKKIELDQRIYSREGVVKYLNTINQAGDIRAFGNSGESVLRLLGTSEFLNRN
ncbi:asparagine synthase-related protein [Cyclobacteriaceae bacterium]|nr:asparagine synthase-related protein [Cyclobacteriaceae bacterium]